MTVKLLLPNRKLNLGDRILKWLGKARLPVMPQVAIGALYASQGLNAEIQATCEWQCFWSAIWNPKVKPRPKPVKGVHRKGFGPSFFVRGNEGRWVYGWNIAQALQKRASVAYRIA